METPHATSPRSRTHRGQTSNSPTVPAPRLGACRKNRLTTPKRKPATHGLRLSVPRKGKCRLTTDRVRLIPRQVQVRRMETPHATSPHSRTHRGQTSNSPTVPAPRLGACRKNRLTTPKRKPATHGLRLSVPRKGKCRLTTDRVRLIPRQVQVRRMETPHATSPHSRTHHRRTWC